MHGMSEQPVIAADVRKILSAAGVPEDVLDRADGWSLEVSARASHSFDAVTTAENSSVVRLWLGQRAIYDLEVGYPLEKQLRDCGPVGLTRLGGHPRRGDHATRSARRGVEVQEAEATIVHA